MKIRVIQVSPDSLAVLFAKFGFAFGVIIAALGIVGSMTGMDDALVRRFIGGQGIALVILSLVYPFISALFSAILGFLAAFVFNISTEFTGGFDVDVEEIQKSERAEPVEENEC